LLGLFAALRNIYRTAAATDPRVTGGVASIFGRMARWQLVSRLWGQPLIVTFVSGTKLVARTGMTSATAEYYNGLHEFTEAGFVLHGLEPGERLVDVGANVGVFTVVGAGVCKGHVIACEPSTAAMNALLDNVAINGLGDRVEVHKVALGEADGVLHARRDGAAVNEMRETAGAGNGADYEEVPVRRLDDVVGGRPVDFLKIDVVGFEHHVLRGAPRLLSDPGLKAVVIGCLRRVCEFGGTPEETLALVTSQGFTPVRYDPVARKLERLGEVHHDRKVLFVRDFDAMAARLKAAPAFTVRGKSF
jgi:FkbM family methyltransferase